MHQVHAYSRGPQHKNTGTSVSKSSFSARKSSSPRRITPSMTMMANPATRKRMRSTWRMPLVLVTMPKREWNRKEMPSSRWECNVASQVKYNLVWGLKFQPIVTRKKERYNIVKRQCAAKVNCTANSIKLISGVPFAYRLQLKRCSAHNKA